VKVWISSRHSIPKKLLDDLESLLNSSSAKNVPHNGGEGVEGIYWECIEASLMGMPLFRGLIYATNGSQEKGNKLLQTRRRNGRLLQIGQRRRRLILQQSGTCSGMYLS